MVARAIERAYDGIEAAHGIHVEVSNGLLARMDGATSAPQLLVSVYNRHNIPQRVVSIGLEYTHKAGILYQPLNHPGLGNLTRDVTHLEHVTFAFDLASATDALEGQRSTRGRRVRFKGAIVGLGSGRRVRSPRRYRKKGKALDL